MMTVLILGVAGLWGSSVARYIARQANLRVLGLDARPVTTSLDDVTLLPQPPTGRALAELLQREQVDVVVHLDWLGEFERVDSETAKQANVLGIMELLGACLRAETPQLIIRSTTLVYGPSLKNPAFIPEQHPLSRRFQTRWLRDIAEAESIVSSFVQRHPRPTISVLRYAPVVGGGLRSVFGDYLLNANPRRVWGFDPRIQLLHGDDALAAISHTFAHPLPGAINVAATDVIPLNLALRRATHPELLTLDALGRALWRERPAVPQFDLDFLRYSCVGDTRRMLNEWGFTPQHSAEAALIEALHERAIVQVEAAARQQPVVLDEPTSDPAVAATATGDQQ